MLGARETEQVLEMFFNDCLRFWTREGYDERAAFEMALDDVRAVKNDPFVPRGKKVDEDAKQKFIQYREMDLGR